MVVVVCGGGCGCEKWRVEIYCADLVGCFQGRCELQHQHGVDALRYSGWPSGSTVDEATYGAV